MTTERPMQLGVVGLGRMGSAITRRLVRDGHRCVVFDVNPDAVAALAGDGVTGATSLGDLCAKLDPPRAVWVMAPAGEITEGIVAALGDALTEGDAVIDGGNSSHRDDIRRAATLGERGIAYLDCGTSGGVFGLERGFCLMVGGDRATFERLEPIFRSLAPGAAAAERTPGRTGEPGSEEQGYLYCGPAGAGHFVKMVHNGVEYGMMAAFAEGFNVLRHADVGAQERDTDAETAPLSDPAAYRYDLDVAAIAELWRRGSVVASWLLDLTAAALHDSPDLDGFSGSVSDSGEGRWTAIAAIEEGVPANVLTAALFARYASRGEDDFANRVLSAMRWRFGGHVEKA